MTIRFCRPCLLLSVAKRRMAQGDHNLMYGYAHPPLFFF